MLILDEYWEAHPELHDVPIYYASSLAKKCMAVFQVQGVVLLLSLYKLVHEVFFQLFCPLTIFRVYDFVTQWF